jgi:hypothetical protein
MIIETRTMGSFVAFILVDDRPIVFERFGALPDELFRAL